MVKALWDLVEAQERKAPAERYFENSVEYDAEPAPATTQAV
jgi:hypothetical protein